MQQNDPTTNSEAGNYQTANPYTMEPPPKKGMSTGKVLLIVFGALGACLLICVIGAFFLIRSIQSGFENVVDDGMQALLVEEIGDIGTAQPGTYTITTDQMLGSLNEELSGEGANIDDLFVRILPGNRIELGISSEGQDLEYTASLNAVDGRLEVSDVEASNSVLDFIAPGSRIANGLEGGVNEYLEQNNLTLVSITTAEGELTLVLE